MVQPEPSPDPVIISSLVPKLIKNGFDGKILAIHATVDLCGAVLLDSAHIQESVEESMEINKIQRHTVIISASGMCEASRIRHHLKHNLWRPECSVVCMGFQADGTLGRRIIEGAKKVRIFGEEIAVNASIYTIGGLLAHADREELLDWLSFDSCHNSDCDELLK